MPDQSFSDFVSSQPAQSFGSFLSGQKDQVPADPYPGLSNLPGFKYAKPVLDLAAGAGGELASHAVNAYNLLRLIPGADKVLPDASKFQEAVKDATPTTVPANVGKFIEGATEFMMPAGAAGKATEGMGIIPRAAAQAGVGGGVSLIQSGGDPVATGAGLILGGAGSAGSDLIAARRAFTSSEPAIALLKALKPSSANPDFIDTVPGAIEDIKAVENPNAPIKTNEDLIAASRDALTKNREAMNAFEAVPTQMNTQVHGAPIAAAMVNAAGDMMRREDPQGFYSLVQRARSYNEDLTLPELKNLLQEGNKRLNTFYNAAPDRQAAMLGAGLNPAIEEAKLGAIRDLYYNALDPENAGAGPREIQQRYGAIADILNAAMRRRNSILGASPINPLAGLREDVLANARLLRSGDVTPPNADSMIETAFKNAQPGGVHPVPADTPPVRGYIGSGPIVTPPPEDASFVRGAPAMTQPPNPARALPPATTHIVTPPDTTTTAILMDAAKGIQRGPNGRFFKVFSNGVKQELTPQQLMDLRATPLTIEDLNRLQGGGR